MSGLTVYCCGPIPRLRRLLETVDGIARLADWRELETLPSVGRCLFAVGMDDLGPLPETTELLRFIRSHPDRFKGGVVGVAVDGTGEVDTKSLARRLILQLDMAGCAFPEHPLAEGTGSTRWRRGPGRSTTAPCCKSAWR